MIWYAQPVMFSFLRYYKCLPEPFLHFSDVSVCVVHDDNDLQPFLYAYPNSYSNPNQALSDTAYAHAKQQQRRRRRLR